MAARRKRIYIAKPPPRRPRKSGEIDAAIYADFMRATLSDEIQPVTLTETRDNLARLRLEYEEDT